MVFDQSNDMSSEDKNLVMESQPIFAVFDYDYNLDTAVDTTHTTKEGRIHDGQRDSRRFRYSDGHSYLPRERDPPALGREQRLQCTG